MSMTLIFALLGGLLVLAFVANRLFRRTRIPDAIVLMAMGLLLGPLMGWLTSSEFQPVIQAFGTLAVILILFEAGLDLDLHDTLRHFPGSILLSFLAYVLTFGLVSLVARWSLGLSTLDALLIGAALACTSSSITVPVLQQMEVEQPARITLLLEASISDAFAVLTVGVLLDLGSSPKSILTNFALRILFNITVSLVLAVIAAAIWSYLLPKLSEQRFWQVLTFAIVLLLYAGVERLHANGLIAVLGFGLALANFRRVDRHLLESSLGMQILAEEHHSRMVSFHSELAFLVRSFFFVLIGIIVKFGRMAQHLPATLGIAGAIALGRYLAILPSRGSWKGFLPLERELVFWIMPRGLITIVLALQIVRARGDELAFLPGLAFGVILATNILVVIGTIRARRLPTHHAPAEPSAAVELKDVT
ncbi:MAG: cation:proton antiporter [Deltaproteobacteria bacterium]